MRFAVAFVAALFAFPVSAHEMRAGAFEFVHPHAAPTPPNATAAVVYVTIKNSGEADALIAASTPEAERVEFHETTMEGDIARMRPIERIEIPANGEAKAAPGGLHLMLIGLKHPVVLETTFEMTLTFEKAGAIEIEAYVEVPPEHEGMAH